MSTKKSLLVAISLLVIALLACSFSAGPNGFTLTTGDTPATAAATAEAPVVIDEAPSTSCLGTGTIISPSRDWTVVVVETNGRIWNPCLLDGSIRPAFTTTFVAPESGTYTYNGVNAVLKDGNKVLAENVNGKAVNLVKGKTYTVVNGPTNGGFELLPLQ